MDNNHLAPNKQPLRLLRVRIPRRRMWSRVVTTLFLASPQSRLRSAWAAASCRTRICCSGLCSRVARPTACICCPSWTGSIWECFSDISCTRHFCSLVTKRWFSAIQRWQLNQNPLSIHSRTSGLFITLKSEVERIWRESGLQLTLVSPAEPSSILHFHSGFSIENTWIMLRLLRLQRMNSESDDHLKDLKFQKVNVLF